MTLRACLLVLVVHGGLWLRAAAKVTSPFGAAKVAAPALFRSTLNAAKPSTPGRLTGPDGRPETTATSTRSGCPGSANPLSSRAIADVVTKAGRAAGILTLSVHTLRHTFVTRLVRSGTDPFMVADLAGHARLDTTLLYSLPTEDERQRAVEHLSP